MFNKSLNKSDTTEDCALELSELQHVMWVSILNYYYYYYYYIIIIIIN
jgi:hypothetical protein